MKEFFLHETIFAMLIIGVIFLISAVALTCGASKDIVGMVDVFIAAIAGLSRGYNKPPTV